MFPDQSLSVICNYFEGRENASRPVVAIVDDDAADANLIAMAFAEAVPLVEIETCRSGEEILNRLQKATERAPIDLVVLDLYMPGIGGIEALARLKSDPMTRTIPIVALSGSMDSADVYLAYDNQANCVILKSFSLDDYQHSIRECARFWLMTAIRPRSPAACRRSA
jgi:CheY-like chemotaxis protein